MALATNPLANPSGTPEGRRFPGISLPIVLMVAAITSSGIGGVWDISWHMTLGRDTFWTPAHIAIYFGGALSGFAAGWMAIWTTFFATEAESAGSVRILGGKAPFGAWIAIWGAVAMLAAGPFDNWWHNAYGLDVRIISPPHVVLFVGSLAIRLGVWLLLLREQNRSWRPGAAAWLFLYLGAVLVEGVAVMRTSDFWPNRQHSSEFFFRASADFPFLLVAIARASRLRWGATLAAGAYMLMTATMVWILPLFAGSPRLGPINHPVSHMVPPPFPLWLVVPAVAIDLIMQSGGFGREWRRDLMLAGLTAASFVLLFLTAQWLFSTFYLSPAADTWFFAGDRVWAYTYSGLHPHDFWENEAGLRSSSVASCLLAAYVSTLAGLWFGNWMTRVRR